MWYHYDDTIVSTSTLIARGSLPGAKSSVAVVKGEDDNNI